ncbi:hypothetical protein ADICEAN_03014 [Cesiribacter andamanensis AMV16]|uniref:SGNH/GDSL hydrolase family protein n=2 Tax=Cesiribacter TaxID=1133570 RepID=M7NJA5_9BACT|nr:hypothetical protein ADICEAN_03014 [Cesiribacter andamanensis AMV16]
MLSRALRPYRQSLVQTKGVNQRGAKARFVRSSMLVLLLLVPVTFIGDRLLGAGLEWLLLESNFRYSRLYGGTAQADVVVLGNSRGHAFYEPEMEKLSGRTIFNLSYNALPISVGRALVEDYLDRYTPSVLVVDVSMLTKTEEQITNSFKAYESLSPRLDKLIERSSEETSTASQIFSLYRFNSEVFHRALYYLAKTDDDWILDKQISATMARNSRDLDRVSFRITKDRMRDLRHIIEVAERKGVTVNLVMGPYYPGYLKKISNLDQFLATIETATGYEVEDYSGLIRQDAMFSDYLHLNKDGSSIFLAELYEDEVF